MARNFYKQLVDIRPDKRYTSYKALKHPWITREKFDNVPLCFLEDWKRRGRAQKMKSVCIFSLNLVDR